MENQGLIIVLTLAMLFLIAFPVMFYLVKDEKQNQIQPIQIQPTQPSPQQPPVIVVPPKHHDRHHHHHDHDDLKFKIPGTIDIEIDRGHHHKAVDDKFKIPGTIG